MRNFVFQARVAKRDFVAVIWGFVVKNSRHVQDVS